MAKPKDPKLFYALKVADNSTAGFHLATETVSLRDGTTAIIPVLLRKLSQVSHLKQGYPKIVTSVAKLRLDLQSK